MRLAAYEHNGARYIGRVEDDAVCALWDGDDLTALIQSHGKELPTPTGPLLPLSAVHLLAPLSAPRQDIICLGMNYYAHAEEAARFNADSFATRHQHAVYFSKRACRITGPGEPVDGHFDLVDSMDYEAELAVILAADACRVPPERVRDYVFGYSVFNDFSARNLQTAHKQFYFGKSLDGYSAMGPVLVTEDEFSWPPAFRIRSSVNGQLRQDSNTELMIFSISHVISELSQGMTLKAGTILAMGTPAGVGMGFDPPRFLRSGDQVSCEIEGIGALVNPIL